MYICVNANTSTLDGWEEITSYDICMYRVVSWLKRSKRFRRTLFSKNIWKTCKTISKLTKKGGIHQLNSLNTVELIHIANLLVFWYDPMNNMHSYLNKRNYYYFITCISLRFEHLKIILVSTLHDWLTENALTSKCRRLNTYQHLLCSPELSIDIQMRRSQCWMYCKQRIWFLLRNLQGQIVTDIAFGKL